MQTPLHQAVDAGHIEAVKALLAHTGVRVNVGQSDGEGREGDTPLDTAEGHIEDAKDLLAHHGVRVNVGASDGEGRQGDASPDTEEDARPHGNSDEIAGIIRAAGAKSRTQIVIAGILRAAGAKTRKQIVEDAEEAAARLEAGAQWTASRYGVQPPFVGVARMAGVFERA